MKIGIIDLDTSHPQNWIPIERELGHDVVALCDAGAVHPVGYALDFAEQHDVPRVFPNPQSMVADVDCVILHGCDWDAHVANAKPFVEAGKSVLIDKPVAGNPEDLRTLRRWVDAGARIAGGSSLRYCRETTAFLDTPASERGTPHTVIAGCGVDEFNYGIHAYAHLAGLMEGCAARVRHLGGHPQRRVQVEWSDGRTGLVIVGSVDGWVPFYATAVTEKGAAQFVADPGVLYRALLERCLPYLAGNTDEPPTPVETWLEPERWAIAARTSWLQGDRWVDLTELDYSDEAGYDGAAFARQYRAMRYPTPS